jgi:His-Xaa-Ser system radical SAM maturase HxsB
MIRLPLRVRAAGDAVLFVNDAGCFFRGSDQLLQRLALGETNPADDAFLLHRGHAVLDKADLSWFTHLHGVASRTTHASLLDYLILVPTLRCNLDCSYCQVSRAHLNAAGYDWTDETLAAVLALIDTLEPPSIKIEFQGGEPTLRPDLIEAVIERCTRFADRQFVVCTNLARIDPAILAILDRPDVLISTSLDGGTSIHQRNRTGSTAETNLFLSNLDLVLKRYGPNKVSALPTIDAHNLPGMDELIEAYASRGLTSIFLRPISFHGFARKRHTASREQGEGWRAYYERFVRKLIRRNWENRDQVLEESYFSLCLRRIFQPGHDRHVDLRSPNPVGVDYIVVDHDGSVYPTDEARMLTRAGVIDLAIGTVADGWDSEKRATLDAHATNANDPDCQRCAYQPFCGRDIVDDLARYGRIDVARHDTEFCRRHMHIFDLAFSLIYSDDPATRYSLAHWLRLPGVPSSFGTDYHDPADAAR